MTAKGGEHAEDERIIRVGALHEGNQRDAKENRKMKSKPDQGRKRISKGDERNLVQTRMLSGLFRQNNGGSSVSIGGSKNSRGVAEWEIQFPRVSSASPSKCMMNLLVKPLRRSSVIVVWLASMPSVARMSSRLPISTPHPSPYTHSPQTPPFRSPKSSSFRTQLRVAYPSPL